MPDRVQNLYEQSAAATPVVKVDRTTRSLLRPTQVADLKDELAGIKSMLNDPRGRIEDPSAMRKDYARIQHMLNTQSPEPIALEHIDEAVRIEHELRTEVTEGMLTQEEMRRNPPGAVGRHIEWERRNKKKILQLKHLRLRLHASNVDLGVGERDVANLELFRPVRRGGELSMDNAQIAKTSASLPAKPGAGPATVFNDREIDTLRQVDPELADQLAMLPNEARSEIKTVVQKYLDQVKEANVAGDALPGETAAEAKKRLRAERADKIAAKHAT